MSPLDAGLVAVSVGATLVAIAAVGAAASLYNLSVALEIELTEMRRANEALLFPDRPGRRWIGGFQETQPPPG